MLEKNFFTPFHYLHSLQLFLITWKDGAQFQGPNVTKNIILIREKSDASNMSNILIYIYQKLSFDFFSAYLRSLMNWLLKSYQNKWLQNWLNRHYNAI